MTRKYFLISLILLHLIFYVLALVLGGTRIADSYDYLYQAENLRNEGSFYAWSLDEPIKPDYFTKRTPAYAVFLYLTNSTEWLVLLIQNAMSIFLWFLVFGILRDFKLSEQKAGWLILAVLCLQSNTLIYTNSILSETPFQLALFLGFYFLYLELKSEKKQAWLLAGSCFSLALLIKPVLLFFWLPLLVYSLIRAFQRRRFQIIWPVLLMPLTILLWSGHNQTVTGWAHYTSISTVNLKDYNTRFMLESAYGVPYADSVIRGINSKADLFSDYEKRNNFIQDTCTALIFQNLPAYTKVHLKGMLAMILDPGRYDYVQFFMIDSKDDGLMYKLARGNFQGMWETVKHQHLLVLLFFFLNLLGSVLLLAGALNGLRAIRRETIFVILLIGVIGYFWILTGPVGTARYKSAILPFLVILSGLAFSKSKLFVKNY